MDRIPLRSGDFVWTLFPYDIEPDGPGPIRHAACVIAAFNQRDAAIATTAPVQRGGLVVGVFTSSQVQKFGDTLPIGVIAVTAQRATRAGGQTPFFIDVRKRAFIPFTRRFFPDIDSPGLGVIGPADKGLFQEVVRQYRLINDRYPEAISNVGPLRPASIR
jgi:hypothetical protein